MAAVISQRLVSLFSVIFRKLQGNLEIHSRQQDAQEREGSKAFETLMFPSVISLRLWGIYEGLSCCIGLLPVFQRGTTFMTSCLPS